MSNKFYTIRTSTLRPAREYSLSDHELTEIVEAGYDYIVVLGPTYRLTSTVDDWLDFGMPDLDGDVGITTLRTSRMEKS